MQSQLGRLLSHIPKVAADSTMRQKSWREFGEACSIDQHTLDDFELAYLTLSNPYPGKHMFLYLLARDPKLLFREIIRHLRHIEREDIIKNAICGIMHNQS